MESRVSRRVHDPHKLLGRGAIEGLALDTGYYIEKVVRALCGDDGGGERRDPHARIHPPTLGTCHAQILPALERVLLCGVDIRAWYSSDVWRLASGRPIQRAHHRKRAMAMGERDGKRVRDVRG